MQKQHHHEFLKNVLHFPKYFVNVLFWILQKYFGNVLDDFWISRTHYHTLSPSRLHKVVGDSKSCVYLLCLCLLRVRGDAKTTPSWISQKHYDFFKKYFVNVLSLLKNILNSSKILCERSGWFLNLMDTLSCSLSPSRPHKVVGDSKRCVYLLRLCLLRVRLRGDAKTASSWISQTYHEFSKKCVVNVLDDFWIWRTH